MGVFLLVVEFISVREKYDAKTKKEMQEAASFIAKLVENDNMREALKAALEQTEKKTENVE